MTNYRDRPLSRRQILAGGLGLAAAPLLGRPASATTAVPRANGPTTAEAAGLTGTVNDIDHVVFLMLENRSFDHLFGTLSGVRGFDDRSITRPDGGNIFAQYDAVTGRYELPFLLSQANNGQNTPSLSHNWGPQHRALNGGKNDNWIAAHRAADGNDGIFTMGYYTRAEVPYHYAGAPRPGARIPRLAGEGGVHRHRDRPRGADHADAGAGPPAPSRSRPGGRLSLGGRAGGEPASDLGWRRCHRRSGSRGRSQAAHGRDPHRRYRGVTRRLATAEPRSRSEPATAGQTAGMLRLLLNVIWLVLSGFWLAVGYALAGLLMFLLIITIPFGFASFRLAGYVLWPFGRTVVRRPSAGAASAIGNVLWFVLAGVWIAIGHVVSGVLLCLTVIGLPLGIANFKLAAVALAPLGKDIVPTADRRAVGVRW